jgi:hypothetical protein
VRHEIEAVFGGEVPAAELALAARMRLDHPAATRFDRLIRLLASRLDKLEPAGAVPGWRSRCLVDRGPFPVTSRESTAHRGIAPALGATSQRQR